MTLLDRLRTWWRRRVADSRSADRDEDAGAAVDYECAVCGTVVKDPAGECPLCRSSEIVPAETATEGDATAATHRPVGSDAGGSIERPRTRQEDGMLLQRYNEYWQEAGGNYRVETSDGTRVVDSREEAAALLRAEDR